MAVIFPFETKFYREVGLPVHFVGHPLMDREPDSKKDLKRINFLKTKQ